MFDSVSSRAHHLPWSYPGSDWDGVHFIVAEKDSHPLLGFVGSDFKSNTGAQVMEFGVSRLGSDSGCRSRTVGPAQCQKGGHMAKV